MACAKITLALRELRWLPVVYHTEYKMALLVVIVRQFECAQITSVILGQAVVFTVNDTFTTSYTLKKIFLVFHKCLQNQFTIKLTPNGSAFSRASSEQPLETAPGVGLHASRAGQLDVHQELRRAHGIVEHLSSIRDDRGI